jgi:hypothetical protein
MNGRIIDFNSDSGDGVIRGEDGSRYLFTAAEYKSKGKPSPGAMVDFEVAGGKAVGVFGHGGGGAGAVAEKAKNAFSSFGKQILHGDPDATIGFSSDQLQSAATAARQGAPTPPPKKIERPDPIVTCTDCGKEISGRATVCPHCGGPVVRCRSCGALLDLSTDRCGGCGAVAKLSVFSAAGRGDGVSCPKCFGDAYRKKANGCLFLLLFVFLWPWMLFSWAISHLVGKPDFMKPEYACSRCDNSFRLDR